MSLLSPRRPHLNRCTVPLNPTVAPRLPRALAFAFAVSCVAALLAGLTGVSAARADDVDGISGTPSDGTGPDIRSRFSYQIAPGQHLDDAYLVRNTGTTAQVMTVFATDAFNTDDGGYGLLDTDAAPADAGNWVTFAGGAKKVQIPLAPGTSQVIPFSVDLPADAAPGDHAAGIVTSVTSPNGQILVDRRVATRLYVRVPGALQPALTISGLTATYHPALNPFAGSTTLKYTLTNNGNVALGANTVVGLRTYFGIGASGLVRSTVAELLPHSKRVVTVSVPGVAQLGYLNPYVSLIPTVEKDAMNPGPLRSVNRDAFLFVMPWWLLIIVLIAAAVWLFIRLRRVRDQRNAAAWIEHMEAEARRRALEEKELVDASTPGDKH